MGAENFYLNVKLKKDCADDIKLLIKSNTIFEKYINWYFDAESCELSLQAAMVSFFPMCEVIYTLCSKINENSSISELCSRNMVHPFDFESSLSFFCWMYTVWKEQLSNFREEWGDFLINPTDYYKSRLWLRKKYYKKFKLDN